MKTLASCLLLGSLLAVVCLPSNAAAHDDPIVTVRVMCDGFNRLDMDAVLGELSDAATVKLVGGVRGSTQIEDWVQQQMDQDLRIEILDIGTPQKLSDGYALTWTGRFSRQDWRQAGMSSRVVSNTVVIHNSRITEWTAEATDAAPPTPAVAPAAIQSSNDPVDSMPELFGIPISLVLAAAVAIAGVAALLFVSNRGS